LLLLFNLALHYVIDVLDQARPLAKYSAGIRAMADPALQGRYPSKDLERAVSAALMCVQEDPAMRPPIGDVVKVLGDLAYNRVS
jgi:hypothetical protein